MRESFGIPYKGSKNQIVPFILKNLPEGDTFVDLFCGGGAVTHGALLDNKYKHYIINDIEAGLAELFVECLHGKHNIENHKEWISREEFIRRRDEDMYVSIVWSFGNNHKDYLYSYDIEPIKKALHYGIIFNDMSYLEELGLPFPETDATDYTERRKIFQDFYKRMRIETGQYQHILSLERIANIERQVRIQDITIPGDIDIMAYSGQYHDIKIPDGAVIYCDIPYKGTRKYKYSIFDYDEFYDWAVMQDNIFISEYDMPDDFIRLDSVGKRILCNNNGSGMIKNEGIYTNRRTFAKLKSELTDIVKRYPNIDLSNI